MAVIEAGVATSSLCRARAARALGLLSAGFSIAILTWLVYLAIEVGAHAPWQFLSSTIDSALTIASGMAVPLPPFRSILMGYILVPATLLLGAFIGLYRERSRRADARSRLLLAVSLVGLAVFHQAMHRKDAGHLLQVAPASIVGAFILAAMFWDRLRVMSIRNARDWVLGGSALVYFVLLGLDVRGLSKWGQYDLVGLSLWPAQRFVDLTHPLAASDRFPAIKAILAIREQTNPRDLDPGLSARQSVLRDRSPQAQRQGLCFLRGPLRRTKVPSRKPGGDPKRDAGPGCPPVQFPKAVVRSSPDDLETSGRRAHQYL